MEKYFQIPGIEGVFTQSINSQSISQDTNFIYMWAKEILEKKIYSYYIENNLESSMQKRHILDLGTGCGIILLMLAKDFSKLVCTGVEIISDLADIAITNFKTLTQIIGDREHQIITANYSDLVKKIKDETDYNTFLQNLNTINNQKFDLIVSNPPYFKKNVGKICKNFEKAISRFEIKSTLFDLINCIKHFLSPNGYSIIIYPLSRKKEVELACLEMQLKIKSFRYTDYTKNTFHYDIAKTNNKTKILFEISHV